MGVQNANVNVIESLNMALSLEYSAVIQYNQHRFLLTGKDRLVYSDFFTDASKEAHAHVTSLGDKIVALGGVPTVEPGVIRQATSLAEMLKQDLELEREALEAYLKAWEASEDNRPLRFWLEDIIRSEQLHIDQLEKITSEREVRSDRVNREIRFRGVS
ncbi:MAG: ferritin-like domain-containing protein [Acidobacteria bacterium]|nr:ferritin-like domain-containing protein [Acidobacteriota bacterium]MCI0664432.1 ferritin-like domain-containing protein [Acidobacteriota bacterium]